MEHQIKKRKLEIGSNNIMEDFAATAATTCVSSSKSKGTFYKTISVYSNNRVIRKLRLKLTVESVDVDIDPPSPSSTSDSEEFTVEEDWDDSIDSMDDDSFVDVPPRRGKEETEIICPVTATKALTNVIILENLAKFLPVPDLLDLRSVSTTWNTAFIPQLRARSSAKVIQFDSADLLSKHNFMATMEKSTKVPFAKLHFSYAPVPGEEVPQLNYMKALLKKYGHLLTHLKISFQIDGPGNQASRFNTALFTKIFKQCHVLQELKIGYIRNAHWRLPESASSAPISFTFWDVPEDQVFPTLKQLKKLQLSLSDTSDMITEDTESFLNALYQVAPNLEELDLTNSVVRPRGPDYNSSIITTLQNNKEDLHKLKCLNLHHLTPQLFQVLNDLSLHHGLCLNKLTLHDVDHQKPLAILADPAQFEMFLGFQSNSIKYLIIKVDVNHHGGVAKHVLALPSFPLLEELEISFVLNMIPIASAALVPFKQLKKLHFEAFGRAGLQVYGDIDKKIENCWNRFMEPCVLSPILTLRDLTITFGIHSINQMVQLGLAAPNLTGLNIGLESPECIRLIWSQWSKLQSLGISFKGVMRTTRFGDDDVVDDGGLLDEVVTGIPVAVHALLNAFIGIDPINAVASFKTQHGISDCLYLTEFKLDARGSSYYQLHDISAYYGFGLPTSKLKNLHIFNCKRISSECRDSLKQMLGAGAKIYLG